MGVEIKGQKLLKEDRGASTCVVVAVYGFIGGSSCLNHQELYVSLHLCHASLSSVGRWEVYLFQVLGQELTNNPAQRTMICHLVCISLYWHKLCFVKEVLEDFNCP